MTDWIEWYVKREPILGDILYPTGRFYWKLINVTENGTVTLYDATRDVYSRLSSEGWFLKFWGNSDFWLWQEGSWSTVQPIEIANGTRTFENCQRGVNFCADHENHVGCCGPKGNNRCCNYNTNRCGPC